MKSLTTPDFWHSYAELSSEMKDQARKAYRLWRDNPFHPSLHFKKVERACGLLELVVATVRWR